MIEALVEKDMHIWLAIAAFIVSVAFLNYKLRKKPAKLKTYNVGKLFIAIEYLRADNSSEFTSVEVFGRAELAGTEYEDIIDANEVAKRRINRWFEVRHVKIENNNTWSVIPTDRIVTIAVDEMHDYIVDEDGTEVMNEKSNVRDERGK